MENRDERLWQMAQKRAAFKKNLFTYIVINTFLWLLWAFTSGRNYSGGIPWPAWCSVGWGIGLAMSYFGAYQKAGDALAEKEYDRLKNK